MVSNKILTSCLLREEAWWERKRLTTSEESWEGFVAEHCGFGPWEEFEQEVEMDVEQVMKEVEEGVEVGEEPMVDVGNEVQEEVVGKEMKLTLEKANLKVKPIIIRQASMWADSFIAREETNLDELVFNEEETKTTEEKEEAKILTSLQEDREQRKEVSKPLPHKMSPPKIQEWNLAQDIFGSDKKNDQFVCNKCKKTLKSARQLQTHKTFVHQSAEEDQIKCYQCGKAFRKSSTLDIHMKGHQETKGYQGPTTSMFGPVDLHPRNTPVAPLRWNNAKSRF